MRELQRRVAGVDRFLEDDLERLAIAAVYWSGGGRKADVGKGVGGCLEAGKRFDFEPVSGSIFWRGRWD
jgi:hypothetical protein